MDDSTLSVVEFKKLKEKAEMDIRDTVFAIFEDFKRKTNSHFTNQSISIGMVHIGEMGHKKSEAIVNSALIHMDIF